MPLYQTVSNGGHGLTKDWKLSDKVDVVCSRLNTLVAFVIIIFLYSQTVI